MQVLVTDPALKELLASCAQTDRQHIADLQGLLASGATTIQ